MLYGGILVAGAGFVVLYPALSALPRCGPLTRLKIYDPLPKKSRSKSGLFVWLRGHATTDTVTYSQSKFKPYLLK